MFCAEEYIFHTVGVHVLFWFRKVSSLANVFSMLANLAVIFFCIITIQSTQQQQQLQQPLLE